MFTFQELHTIIDEEHVVYYADEGVAQHERYHEEVINIIDQH